MIKFSIIVPVYNVETVLPRCIESILNQTFKDFELILIDDGSLDNSGQICDEYAKKDSRVIVFHKDNAGVSAARNKGLDVACGEYIVFIDSDDYVDSIYLENFNKHSADIIITGFQIEEHLTKNLIHKQYFKNTLYDNISSDIRLFLYENGFLGYCCGRAFKRNIITQNNINFKDKLSLGEDMLFATEVLLYSNSVYTSDSIGYHYVRYKNELKTLSSVKISTAFCVQKYEATNDYLYSLFKTHFPERAEMIVAKRSAIFILDIMNNNIKTKFSFIKYLYKTKWISKTFDYVDEIYSQESKKLKYILKTKSAFLLWLYLKYSSIKNS